MIGTSDKIQPHNTNLNLPREEKISGAYFIAAVGFICLVSSLQVMNKDELTIILIVGFLGLSVLWMILAKKIYFPLSLAIFTFTGFIYFALSHFDSIFVDLSWMKMHSFSVIPRQASYIFIFPITIIVFRSMWLGVLTSKHTDRYMLLLFFIGITNWILGMYFADTLSRWVEYIPSLLSSANREIIFLVALTYFFFQKRIFNAFLFVFIFFLFLTIVVGGTLEGILTELVNTKTAVTDWGFGLGVLKTGTGFTLMLLFLMIYLVLPGRFLALFAATIMVSWFIATLVCAYYAYDLVPYIDNLEISPLDAQPKGVFIESYDQGGRTFDVAEGTAVRLPTNTLVSESGAFRIPWEFLLDYNFVMRAQFINDALNGFFNSFGIGVGYGNEATMAQSYGASPLDRQMTPLAEWTSYNHLLNSHHNDFYTMFYRLGLVGGTAFLWFVCVYCFPKINRDTLPSLHIKRQCFLLFTLVFITLSIHVSTQSPSYIFGLTFVIGYLLACNRLSELRSNRKNNV